MTDGDSYAVNVQLAPVITAPARAWLECVSVRLLPCVRLSGHLPVCRLPGRLAAFHLSVCVCVSPGHQDAAD